MFIRHSSYADSGRHVAQSFSACANELERLSVRLRRLGTVGIFPFRFSYADIDTVYHLSPFHAIPNPKNVLYFSIGCATIHLLFGETGAIPVRARRRKALSTALILTAVPQLRERPLESSEKAE